MLSPARISALDIPHAVPVFTGLSKTTGVDAILGKPSQWPPSAGGRQRDMQQVEAWALYRFTRFGMRKLARLLRLTVGEVKEAIRSIRVLREKECAWFRAIRNAGGRSRGVSLPRPSAIATQPAVSCKPPNILRPALSRSSRRWEPPRAAHHRSRSSSK